MATSTEERVLQELDRIKEAKAIILPPTDAEVREKLKSIGEPRVLFAEKDAERRDRLRFILSQKAQELGIATGGIVSADAEMMAVDQKSPGKKRQAGEEDEDEDEEEFFTEGSQSLLQSRRNLVLKSLLRAKARLDEERQWRNESQASAIRERRQANHSKLKVNY